MSGYILNAAMDGNRSLENPGRAIRAGADWDGISRAELFWLSLHFRLAI